jgi:hypothetical protein
MRRDISRTPAHTRATHSRGSRGKNRNATTSTAVMARPLKLCQRLNTGAWMSGRAISRCQRPLN